MAPLIAFQKHGGHHRDVHHADVRRLLVLVGALVAALVAVVFIGSSGTTPVGLKQPHTFGAWKLAVASVDWNAGSAPPAGRSIRVNVAVQYLGDGVALSPFAFVAEGANHARYPLMFPVRLIETMYSGARENFPLDFTVAANDLNTLKLDVYYGRSTTPVQFALRSY
jgi:hypothetical protein